MNKTIKNPREEILEIVGNEDVIEDDNIFQMAISFDGKQQVIRLPRAFSYMLEMLDEETKPKGKFNVEFEITDDKTREGRFKIIERDGED